MLSWERCLSVSLPQSIETPLPSTVAQLGSSVMHPTPCSAPTSALRAWPGLPQPQGWLQHRWEAWVPWSQGLGDWCGAGKVGG